MDETKFPEATQESRPCHLSQLNRAGIGRKCQPDVSTIIVMTLLLILTPCAVATTAATPSESAATSPSNASSQQPATEGVLTASVTAAPTDSIPTTSRNDVATTEIRSTIKTPNVTRGLTSIPTAEIPTTISATFSEHSSYRPPVTKAANYVTESTTDFREVPTTTNQTTKMDTVTSLSFSETFSTSGTPSVTRALTSEVPVTYTTPTSSQATTNSSQTTPIPTQTTPIPTQTTPIPTQTTPIPTQTTPIPTQTTPIPTQTTPIPTQDTPIPTQDTPTSPQATPTQSQDTPNSTVPTSSTITSTETLETPYTTSEGPTIVTRATPTTTSTVITTSQIVLTDETTKLAQTSTKLASSVILTQTPESTLSNVQTSAWSTVSDFDTSTAVTIATTKMGSNGSSLTTEQWIGIGIAIGVLVAIVVIVLCLILWMRARRNKLSKKPSIKVSMEDYSNTSTLALKDPQWRKSLTMALQSMNTHIELPKETGEEMQAVDNAGYVEESHDPQTSNQDPSHLTKV